MFEDNKERSLHNELIPAEDSHATHIEYQLVHYRKFV